MLTKSVKKVISLMLSLLLLTAAVSGCYPGGTARLPEESDEEEIREQILNIAEENGHLAIEARIPEDTPKELPRLEVHVMEWDEETINAMFLAQRPGLEHAEYPSDDFTGENYDFYESKDAEAYWLVYEAGRLSSDIREKFGVYGYGTLMSVFGTYYLPDYFDGENIGLFPASGAVDRVEAVLTELGVTNFSEPAVYPVTADKANRYLADYNEYQKWTAEDEIYFLQFPQAYEGIPVTTDNPKDRTPGGHGAYFVGSSVTAAVAQDEILSLDCEHLFSPDYRKGESVPIQCSAENALKIAAEHYQGVALPDITITIKNIQLVYVPFEQQDEKNFTMVPMWRVDVAVKNSNNDSLMDTADFLFIDVQTGDIIIW